MAVWMRVRDDVTIMNDTMTSPPSSPLVRPVDDRVIAGVASGLARRLGVGPGWMRVTFVVLSFFGGLGILLYIVGWLAIRDEASHTAIAENWIGDLEGSTEWVGLGLIVLAGVVLLGSTNVVRTELVLAGGLFLAGVLLYRGTLGRAQEGGVGGEDETLAGGSPVTAGSVDVDTEALGAGGDGGVASSPARSVDERPLPPPPPPPPPPRPRSYLGRIVIASVLIVIGGVSLLDNLDVIDPGFRHYVAAGVLVVGLGLIVGTFFGRARGLIALGLLVLPLLLLAAAIRVPLSGEYGDRSFAPATATELRPTYELSGGQIRLDLRQLDAFPADATVDVELGVGELVVWVPDDVDVDVDASVGIGAMELFGERSDGFGVDDTVQRAGGDGVVDLVLNLDVGIGNLEVRGTP